MPDTRNKRDYGRGYDAKQAKADRKRGVHPDVIAIRLGHAEHCYLRPGKKLSPADVAAIRASKQGAKRTARAFGVHYSLVERVRAGLIWKGAAR